MAFSLACACVLFMTHEGTNSSHSTSTKFGTSSPAALWQLAQLHVLLRSDKPSKFPVLKEVTLAFLGQRSLPNALYVLSPVTKEIWIPRHLQNSLRYFLTPLYNQPLQAVEYPRIRKTHRSSRGSLFRDIASPSYIDDV